MSIRIVRLGTERLENEGLRIGTVRRPPRGVKKEEYVSRNWFDVWLPEVAPSPELMQLSKKAQTDKEWETFRKKYRKELAAPDKNRLLQLLAAFSLHSDFSVGCYCDDHVHCHLGTLCDLLREHGAVFA